MFKERRTIYIAVAVVVIIGLAGLTWYLRAPKEEKIVKIGIAGPMTGYAASQGEDYEKGARLALEEVGYEILGYPIEVVIGDTGEMEAGVVVATFTMLLDKEKVDFIVSGYASPNHAELEFVSKYDVPYILSGEPSVMAEIITEAGSGPEWDNLWNYACIYYGYRLDWPLFVESLMDEGLWEPKYDPPRVAFIVQDIPYCHFIVTDEGALIDLFTELGWEITMEETIAFETISDWSAILAKIHERPPDIIINTDVMGGSEAIFLDQFLRDPVDALLFFQFGPSTKEFIDATGDASDGVLYNYVGASLCKKYEPGKEFFDKFKDKWGYEAGSYAGWVYDETKIWLEAVRRAGDPFDHKAVSAEIEKGSWDNVQLGTVTFDQDTHTANYDPDLIPTPFFQLWNLERISIYPKWLRDEPFSTPPWFK